MGVLSLLERWRLMTEMMLVKMGYSQEQAEDATRVIFEGDIRFFLSRVWENRIKRRAR